MSWNVIEEDLAKPRTAPDKPTTYSYWGVTYSDVTASAGQRPAQKAQQVASPTT